ncbi:hypothetical protein JW926_18275, partial [Candidatus Sumerlaeota bacterium]|nr:hypothetical protein [Candidatus Sumerlaeota bacterium]
MYGKSERLAFVISILILFINPCLIWGEQPGELPPVVTNVYPEVTPVSGSAAIIKYTVSQENSHNVSLPSGSYYQYSVNSGTSWNDATLGSGGDGTTGLTTSETGVEHELSWNSVADLPNQLITTVKFRIKVKDDTTQQDSEYEESGTFTVDNCIPVVSNVAPTPTPVCGDDALIKYTVSHCSSKNVSLPSADYAQYSTNSGQSWNNATLGSGGDGTSGLSTSPSGVEHKLSWNSEADIPNQKITTVQFRIRVKDANNNISSYAQSGTFTVDNCIPVVSNV